MTKRSSIALVLLIAFSGPAAAGPPRPPLTFDGREISPVVEVWTLPSQEPAADADEADDEPSPSESLVRIGLVTGALWGCILGIALAAPPSDIGRGGLCVLNGLFFGSVGAGVGALVKWIRQDRNSQALQH